MREKIKRLAVGLALMAAGVLMFYGALQAADTYTSNYVLRLPDLDIEDEVTPWGEKYNNNFVLVDAAIKSVSDFAMSITTGNFATDIAALQVSTGALQVQIDAVAVSTGNNAHNIDALQIFKATATTNIDALQIFKATATTSIDAINAAISTAAFLASTQTFSGYNIYTGSVTINSDPAFASLGTTGDIETAGNLRVTQSLNLGGDLDFGTSASLDLSGTAVRTTVSAAPTTGKFTFGNGGQHIVGNATGISISKPQVTPTFAFQVGPSSFTVSSDGAGTFLAGVTASSFTGVGAALTGVTISVSSHAVSGHSIAHTESVAVATATLTMRGGRTGNCRFHGTISNGSGAERTYTYSIYINGILDTDSSPASQTNSGASTEFIYNDVHFTSIAGANTCYVNINSSNATGTQTILHPDVELWEY